jgi:hypothetical protein
MPLARLMHGLQSSYTQAFNRRPGRAGHLFQGRYKAFLVERTGICLRWSSTSTEPGAGETVECAQEHPWSSDRFYRRGRGPEWLDVDLVLSMLSSRRVMAIGLDFEPLEGRCSIRAELRGKWQ